MPFTHPLRAISKRYDKRRTRSLPAYDSVVAEYRFEEGLAPTGSMNNIFFDSKNPPVISSTNLVVNGDFSGTYTGGIAPNWTADVGVTASEDINESGGPAQRVTTMNGSAQALRRSASDPLVVGDIFKISVRVKRNAGAGNLQLRCDTINGMTGGATYDIPNSAMPVGVWATFYFYGTAAFAGNDVIITANNTALDVTISNFAINEVEGGNHLVMDFNLYDEASRGVNFYDFNGADEFARLHNNRQVGLNISQDLSFVAICKLDVDQTGVLFSKWNPQGNQRGWQAPRVTSTGTFRRYETYWSHNGTALNTQASLDNSAPATIPWSNWQSIGMTKSNQTVQFYQNEASLANGASSITSGVIFSNTSSAIMGATLNTSGNPIVFFNGRIGKVVVWANTVLTRQQYLQAFSFLRSSYGF